MNMSLQILFANVASTWFMVGLIWIVQVVHYPLFDGVGEQGYLEYQQRHQMLITYVVLPVMLIELASSILLACYPMEGMSKPLIYVGIGLLGLAWVSTFFIQVPCHEKLAAGFDPEVHVWLVRSNWIRTIAWSARGAVVIWMLAGVFGKQV